jgi:hypothetical protein
MEVRTEARKHESARAVMMESDDPAVVLGAAVLLC